MKMNIATRNRRRLAAPLLALLPLALPAQTTGWKQTGAGPYDYNDPANWVGGTVNDINGRWDESLTLATHQVVVFGVDTVLTYPLHFGYAGAFDLRLQGSGGDYTLTLGGDITHATASGRTISFGNTGTGSGLSLDFGGVPRTFTVLASHILKPYNALSNGSVTLTGGGTLQMFTDNASGVGVDFLVDQSTTLLIDSTASGSVGTTRARDVTLRSGNLKVVGNSGANAADTITGAIRVTARPSVGINYITLDANASRNSQVTADELVRENEAIVLIRGDNLGATPGANVANLVVTTPPALVGGGGAASTQNISIVPWMIASTSVSGSAETFVTYDAGGFRPLNTTTEYDTSYTNGFAGPVAGTDHNVKIAGGAIVEFTGADNWINALYIGSSTTGATLNGTGMLHVASGAVFMSANTTTTINPPLDFGPRQGVIGVWKGKGTTLNSDIHGSGGVVFYQPAQSAELSSGGTGVSVTGAGSTYTGDTIIHGRADCQAGVLPSGSRLGDLYVYGAFVAKATMTINGLHGNGIVARNNSGGATLTIGDNDADGDFGGPMSDYGALSIVKIGAGEQRLAGYCTYDGTTTVNGGTLIMDGYFTNTAVTVNSGATLRGAGMIDKSGIAVTVASGGTLAPGGTNGTGTLTVSQGNVVFESGARMAVVAGRGGHGALRVEGEVTGNVTVPLAVDGEGAGRWKVMAAARIEPLFAPAAPGVFVTKENEDTELWVERPPAGTAVIIR